MASVCTPDCDVDYSLVDGRVRSFKYNVELVYDEDEGVSKEGWKDRLVSFVLDCRLNEDDGRGLHAFVYRMIDEKLVAYERLQ